MIRYTERASLPDTLIVLRCVRADYVRFFHLNAEVLRCKVDRVQNGEQRGPPISPMAPRDRAVIL